MKNKPICLYKTVLITSTALSVIAANSLSALARADRSALSTGGTSASAPLQSSQHRRVSSGPHSTDAAPEREAAHGRPALHPAAETPAEQQLSASEVLEAGPIIVTGSHIRGKIAAGADLDVFSREDLERSGFATVQDFFRTLPQNFSGGGGTEYRSAGELEGSNLFAGAAVDLRGFGADSTLILINGRRQPAAGVQGNFTDVTLIPQSAIERIEILPDGASALYGSDAVGGVVNFILRTDFDGAETRLRYGRSTEGNMDEYRLSQSFGRTWDSGNALISYEYYFRNFVPFSERDFALTADQRPHGGTDFRQYHASPGNILDPITFVPAYAIPSNQDGRQLTVNDLLAGQINLQDRDIRASILPEQERHSVFLNIEQNLTDKLTLFSEVHYSQRRTKILLEAVTSTLFVFDTNPFYVNPFDSDSVVVAYSFASDLGPETNKARIRNGAGTAGFRLDLASWRLETAISHGQQRTSSRAWVIDREAVDLALADNNPATALNVFGNGTSNNPATLAALQHLSERHTRSSITNFNAVVDGPLLMILDREISVAAGVDYRSERFKHRGLLGDTPFRIRNLDRRIYAAFVEFYAPLIAPESDIDFVHILDLSVAGRIDKYSDAGTTENPKVGLRYAPLEGLFLNATYGTSFRAPNLDQLSTASNTILVQSIPDPLSSTGNTRIISLFGNNPEMTPEKSISWTFGLSVDDLFLSGLTVSANYFRTVFKDRIVGINARSNILLLEDIYASVIKRNPTESQIAELCSQPIFIGTSSSCVPELIGAIVDYRTQNMSKNTVQGVDASVNYSTSLSTIDISIGSSATYIINHKVQFTPTSPNIEFVDTIDNPVDFRARGSVTISQAGSAATVTVNYTDSFENNQSAFRRKVQSFTTVDVNLSVAFDRNLHIDAEGPLKLNVSATNLFGTDPPFADTDLGFAPSAADPLGRILSAELSFRW